MAKQISISALLLSLVIGFSFVASTGCTPSRPDPRANPDFDEEAYNDPNASLRKMQGQQNQPKK